MDRPGSKRTAPLTLATLATAMTVWVLRRPDQLLAPYAWVEEARMIELWQQLGPLRQALAPVNGQLILSSSASVAALLSLDVLRFPVLAYLTATLWFLGLLLLWLVPRSRLPLKVRVCFVLAMVLVPINPEPFGVLEYSFWWVTLWVLPCLFWDAPRWWLRVPVLAVAGLSSLAASTLFVVFGVLWAARRRRHDLVSAVILLSTFALQVAVYWTSPRNAQIVLVVGDVARQAFANVGTYLLGWLPRAQPAYLVVVGVVVVAAVAWLAVSARRPAPELALDWTVLLVVLASFTVLSSIPAAGQSDPYTAGPRYYFLPFLGVSWLAVLAAWGPWARARRVGAAVLALSLLTLAPAWSRSHDHLDWRREVLAACRHGGDGRVPVHFAGSRADVWTVTLTPATCARVTGDAGAARQPTNAAPS